MDILLSDAFFPTFGGAHGWMYEVYSRWPKPVHGVVQDYRDDVEWNLRQEHFDRNAHGSLILHRSRFQVDNISLFSTRTWGNLTTALRALKSLAEDGRIEILHMTKAFPEGLWGLAWKRMVPNRRLVTYVHGEEVLVAQTSRQLRWLAKMVYRCSSLIIVNSKFVQSLLGRFMPCTEGLVIHPGVDSNAFCVDPRQRQRCRSQWGCSEKTVVLTTIARMEPRKNHARVLEAVAALRKEGLPLVYVIGSSGEEKDRLIQKARDLGVTESVRFTGYLSDEERISTFASSDIHVMPSVQVGPMIEGFGIVFLEAAAAGIPSIAGNVGGQPEAVKDGETGLVIDGTDVSQIKESIRQLAFSRELRRSMGDAGRKWASAHDWKRVAERTYSAVQAVVQD